MAEVALGCPEVAALEVDEAAPDVGLGVVPAQAHDAVQVPEDPGLVAAIPVEVGPIVEDLDQDLASAEALEVDPAVDLAPPDPKALDVVGVLVGRSPRGQLNVLAEAFAFPADEEVPGDRDPIEGQPEPISEGEVERREPDAVPATSAQDMRQEEVREPVLVVASAAAGRGGLDPEGVEEEVVEGRQAGQGARGPVEVDAGGRRPLLERVDGQLGV